MSVQSSTILQTNCYLSPALQPNSYLSSQLFKECAQVLSNDATSLKGEVCQLLSHQILSYHEITSSFFERAESIWQRITESFCDQTPTLMKQILVSNGSVTLGGNPLIDIVARLTPKVPAQGMLATAIDFNDLEAAEALIEHGAEVNQPDDQGNVPLHHAAKNPKTGPQAIELLLKHGGLLNWVQGNTASIYVENDAHDTPFFAAVKQYGLPLENLQALIKHGAEVNGLKHQQACSHQRRIYIDYDPTFGFPIIRWLDYIQAPPVCFSGEDHLTSPLHAAIRSEKPDIRIIKFLLEQGADPTKPGHYSPSPTSVAALKNLDSSILAVLLEHGGEVVKPFRLLLDLKDPKMESVDLFLKTWQNLSRQEKEHSDVLHTIAENVQISLKDKVYIIEELLKLGMDPNERDKLGDTPFGIYVFRARDDDLYLQGLKAFVAHGADINLSMEGETPLDWFQKLGDMDQGVAYLRSQGALTQAELDAQ